MKFAYSEDGQKVLLNQAGIASMLTGVCTKDQRTEGMRSEYYTAPDGILTAKSQSEIDEIKLSENRARNKGTAGLQRNLILNKLRDADFIEKIGMPPVMSEVDKQELEDTINLLQADVDGPSSDAVYNPPMPPGVTPPTYSSFTVQVTREEGWQGALGYRVELHSADEYFSPDQMALAVYTNPDCTDYEFTTGGFVKDIDNVWGAVRPAGFEPGDVDINFGLLYGPTPMTCWTMKAGRQKQVINAYEVE